MRNTISFNDGWSFSKDNKSFETVTLPHTWNNLDGQDGGSDYLRQTCYYKKQFTLQKYDGRRFIEFGGVNHHAVVTLNGKTLGEHKGGFSTFRFDITDVVIEGQNELCVSADNSDGLMIYPQAADFTFFGGIYRNVKLIEVGNTYFDIETFGAQGIFVTPKRVGNYAEVSVRCNIKGDCSSAKLKLEILDDSGAVVCETESAAQAVTENRLELAAPRLWNGNKDPYMYSLRATILQGEASCDVSVVPFGVRDFRVDNERGFILNGEEYHLHGVSRHQDKQDKGWAISPADHEQDMALIKEVGATTIRLAHYQHDQYFYDLCDKEGMVIWAEIPFITTFMEGAEARENTLSQMAELVNQNYNHPGIFFWGITNEITIGGETDALVENQKALVDLVKKYDTTRLTTLANVSFVEMDSPQNFLTDILSYNHYYGWYGGKLTDNEEWIDEFHAKYPDRPLGISEYGAEGIMTLHSDTPKVRDYSEEYHAVYHEHMLKIFAERPFIWSTHQWNMFDFAADARDEGGVQGRNNKGLVSYDRTTKKDAYFIYKAYWNAADEFVHITGRRYFDRPSETVTIKVYSNQDEVCLTVNGTQYGPLKGDKIFLFENVALNMGENTLVATTKGATDEIKLNRVTTANESYALPQEEPSEGAKNWFLDIMKDGAPAEMTFDPQYYSIKDKLNDILANPEATEMLMNIMQSNGKSVANPGMLKMVGNMKMEIILKMAGDKMPEGFATVINAKLQKIKK